METRFQSYARKHCEHIEAGLALYGAADLVFMGCCVGQGAGNLTMAFAIHRHGCATCRRLQNYLRLVGFRDFEALGKLEMRAVEKPLEPAAPPETQEFFPDGPEGVPYWTGDSVRDETTEADIESASSEVLAAKRARPASRD